MSDQSPNDPLLRRPQSNSGKARIRRRRITAETVAAVCEELGEDVSLRNVQRILGGSFRDLGPLVRAWRNGGADATIRPTPNTSNSVLFSLLQDWVGDFAAAETARTRRMLLKSTPRMEPLLAHIVALIRVSTERSDRRAVATPRHIALLRHEIMQLRDLATYRAESATSPTPAPPIPCACRDSMRLNESVERIEGSLKVVADRIEELMRKQAWYNTG